MPVYEDRGLLVAEHGSDHASVQRVLREHDDALRLIPQPVDGGTALIWKVYRYVGSDRPAAFVCAWTNDKGDPLPLTHRLVDLVKTLDPSQRGHAEYVDDEIRNARVREKTERRLEADLETIREEAVKRAGRITVQMGETKRRRPWLSGGLKRLGDYLP